MPKKANQSRRRRYPPASLADPPLLRLLIAETTRRGQTLAALAEALGITYERLAQYRRGEGDIARTSRAVLERAAAWLGVPTVLVHMLAGTVRLTDFVWPGTGSLRERLNRELGRLRNDSHIGGFVPEQLMTADQSVQLLVVLLYHELNGLHDRTSRANEWMRVLHAAAAGSAAAEAELARLRSNDLSSPALVL
jgi:transcriptional regulator with XRE-family HTH domain